MNRLGLGNCHNIDHNYGVFARAYNTLFKQTKRTKRVLKRETNNAWYPTEQDTVP